MVKPPARLANLYAPQSLQQQKERILRRPGRRRRSGRKNDELRPITLQTSASSEAGQLLSAGATAAATATAAAPYQHGKGSPSSSPTGWAKVRMGSTVVICHVRAPVVASSLATGQYYDGEGGNDAASDLETGTLACSVHLPPHLLALLPDGYGGPAQAQARRVERSLERQLHQALIPSVPLSQYPKSAILLQVTVVSAGEQRLAGNGSGGGSGGNGGALLGPCVLASSLALADAGVELYDIVTCGRVALRLVDNDINVQGDDEDMDEYDDDQQNKLNKPRRHPAAVEVLVDPTGDEEEAAVAVLTVAHMGAWKEVAYWNQQANGEAMALLDPAAINDAAEYCLEMCRTLHKFVARHLHLHHPPPPPPSAPSAPATSDTIL